MNRRALGRGLTNLIPVDSEEKGSDGAVVLIDASSVKPNPYQPRTEFDIEEIASLAQSIENQGLLQPILLRKKQNFYEIISGERRFRALKHLGRDQIPGIVKANVSDKDMLELALVENIQRSNLSDIEEAIAYNRLLVECGLSHEELSKRVGKSRSTITNALRLLKLPDEVQAAVRNRSISGGHARALLAIAGEEKQKALALRIVEEGLSVRDVEKIAQGTKEKPTPKAAAQSRPPIDPDLAQTIEKLQYRFGNQVAIHQDVKGKGKIEIHFFTNEDLNRILDLILA